MTTNIKPAFLKAIEILGESAHDISYPARLVYSAIWNRLRVRQQLFIWMDEAELMRRTRLRAEQISIAKSELNRLGLLFITPGLTQDKLELGDASPPAIYE
jgi:hypothetical protein